MINKTIFALVFATTSLLTFTPAQASSGTIKTIDCTKAKQVKICRAIKFNPFARKSATTICRAYYGQKATAIDYQFRTGWKCLVP
jgi:hypothetical protein